MSRDDSEVRVQVARVERLLKAIETLPDEEARATALEAVEALVLLYGEGLERILERTAAADRALLDGFAEDELLAHLLLLHGLHPLDVGARVNLALEEVRPYLRSHGGDVELVAVEEPVVRLRLEGTCEGCPSSSATSKMVLEEAIQRRAPELERIETEGVELSANSTNTMGGLVPLEAIEREDSSNGAGWTVVGGLPQLAGGGLLPKDVSGRPVLFLSLDGGYYAYRDRCPACDRSLAESALEGAELACAHCRRRYDVRRAGRCLDLPELHLEPLPLLVGQAGIIKVAVPPERAERAERGVSS